jgi:hypothetical protein
MSIKTETYTKDRQLSKHFALHEFKCKESNTIKYSEETVALLEKIFSLYSKISKAIITSGYRTPEYSVKVGGTKDDGHTVGIAVDVKWYDKQNHIIPPKYIACVAQDIGFTGIGIMSNSIHLDTRTTENYKNGKWWGDETNGKNNITDFYSYTGLSREEADKVLGRTTEEEKEPIVEEPKPTITEEPKKEEVVVESTPIIPEKVETEDAPKVNVVIDAPDESAAEIIKKNTGVIIRFFEFLIELIKKIFNKE